jgi:hypothetical protein
MSRGSKLLEIREVTNESDQCSFPNIEWLGIKRGTAKGNVFRRKHHRTIARTNQEDWQTVKMVRRKMFDQTNIKGY